MNTAGIGLFTSSDDTLNEVPVSAVKEGVTPSMFDINVEKKKLSSLEHTTVLGSFLPLPTHVTTSAGNAPDKGNMNDVVVPVESIRAISERFANIAYGFFLGKRLAYLVVVNYVRSTLDVYLLKDDVRNMLVWVKLHGVPTIAFSKDGLSAIAMKLGTPLMPDSYTFDMCLRPLGRSSYARVMVEL
nr:hypothetical protein [Tanacetum cinerariifolium]